MTFFGLEAISPFVCWSLIPFFSFVAPVFVWSWLSLFALVFVIEVGVLIPRHVIEGIEIVVTVVSRIGSLFGIEEFVLMTVEVSIRLCATGKATHFP